MCRYGSLLIVGCVLAVCRPGSAGVTDRPPKRSLSAAPPKTLSLNLGNERKLDLVLIPSGEFEMGSPENEKERQAYEMPVHKVKITKPFYMGKCEVTNAQYRRFRPGHHSEYLDGDDQPVLFVSWYDADAFCRWLSKKMRKTVRLPTEAEWEYACRAGTRTRFHSGDRISRHMDSADLPKVGWYGANSRGRSHAVGRKPPNAFGLHDMHGNAWEWCADWYAKDYYRKSPEADPQGPESGIAKVLRGGSYRFWTTYYCRSAHRYCYRPDARECVTGFRVVVETGKGGPRSTPKYVQPWPAPRRIARPDRPINQREVAVARAFGGPAVVVPNATPTIDGKLDDPAWKKARPLRFRFMNGRSGPASNDTVAKILCDGKSIYFAVDCREEQMDRLLIAGKKRDDPTWPGDAVYILMDAHNSRKVDKSYYEVGITPTGRTRETQALDISWNPKLRTAANRRKDGWTVKLALPLAEMGIGAGQVPTVMGVNIIRDRPELNSRRGGRPRLCKLVPHSWPTDDPDVFRPGEEVAWAPLLSDYGHNPVRFGHAILEVGTKRTTPPAKLFELIAREDFSSGTRGRLTKGKVEPGGYMGVGNALRFPQKEGATLFRAPLKKFRDVQILATVKAEGGRNIYWHSFGKIFGNNKCCPRQVTTLTRDFTTLDPSFTYCDGAGRMEYSSTGLADPYYAGFRRHLSWTCEPTIGRIYFAGPKHWAVAYTRVGEMRTQHPHHKPVDPDTDELPGWFFHPAGKYDILISDVVMFKGVDNEPPEKVTSVKCRVQGNRAVLSWRPAKDNTLTVWYKVVAGKGEDAKTVAEVAKLSVSLPLAKVRGKELTVQAVDFFENFSEPSRPVTVKTSAGP